MQLPLFNGLKRQQWIASGLGIGVILSTAGIPAIAQTFGGDAIYKVNRTSGPALVIANRSPGERITVDFTNATTTRRVTANECGLVVLRDTSSSALSDLQFVDNQLIDISTLPTQLLPRCVDGNLEEPRTANFKTGAGEVVIVKTPNTVYQAIYVGGRTASFTANACGFVVVGSTATRDFTSPEYSDFVIGGTAHAMASLPDAALEPLCRSGAMYVPDVWP